MLQHHPEPINLQKITLEMMASEMALYWKTLGKQNDNLALERAKEFLELVHSKNSKITNFLHTNSPIQRKWFTSLTGIDLGKTNKQMREAICQWLGN